MVDLLLGRRMCAQRPEAAHGALPRDVREEGVPPEARAVLPKLGVLGLLGNARERDQLVLLEGEQGPRVALHCLLSTVCCQASVLPRRPTSSAAPSLRSHLIHMLSSRVLEGLERSGLRSDTHVLLHCQYHCPKSMCRMRSLRGRSWKIQPRLEVSDLFRTRRSVAVHSNPATESSVRKGTWGESGVISPENLRVEGKGSTLQATMQY